MSEKLNEVLMYCLFKNIYIYILKVLITIIRSSGIHRQPFNYPMGTIIMQ